MDYLIRVWHQVRKRSSAKVDSSSSGIICSFHEGPDPRDPWSVYPNPITFFGGNLTGDQLLE